MRDQKARSVSVVFQVPLTRLSSLLGVACSELWPQKHTGLREKVEAASSAQGQ